MFKQLNLPVNVYIHWRNDSNKPGEQWVAWKAQNLCQFEPIVEDIAGIIVGAEYNAETMLSGVPVIVKACGKPSYSHYAMLVNRFATNAVKSSPSYTC